MYNGIGLQTARGSGTNGYVQTNKFLVKYRTTSGPPKPPLPGHGDDAGAGLGGMRMPNREILEHDRKRQVELKLLVLRDALEEQGYTEGEIEERVEEARRAAEAEEAGTGAGPPALPGRGGFTDTQSHHVAARKEKQLEILRGALGLDAEDVKKKGDVESDVESGELVPGKYSEELDTAGQKDNKVSKDDRKDAKKDKKQKGNDKRSHSKRSKKSMNDSDSDYEHDKKKKKKKKKKKSSRHDSEDDSDSEDCARDRKRQLDVVGLEKNVPERRRVASSSESSGYSSSSINSSESDDRADSYESEEKRKELYKQRLREEERKELEKQKQREEERNKLEKQRQREAERMELDKQKQREREERQT